MSAMRLLHRIGDIAAGAVLAVLMVLTFLDVCGRYFFNSPVVGAYEFTEIAMALIVFGALPAVTARREHITTGLFENLLRRGWRRAQQVSIALVSALAMGGLAWRMYDVAGNMAALGTYTPLLRIRLAPLAYLMAGLAAIATVIVLAQAVAIIRGKSAS